MSTPNFNELAQWVAQTATDAVRNDGLNKFDGDSKVMTTHLWHNVIQPELERCGVDMDTRNFYYPVSSLSLDTSMHACIPGANACVR
jgi:hypothetical protein